MQKRRWEDNIKCPYCKADLRWSDGMKTLLNFTCEMCTFIPGEEIFPASQMVGLDEVERLIGKANFLRYPDTIQAKWAISIYNIESEMPNKPQSDIAEMFNNSSSAGYRRELGYIKLMVQYVLTRELLTGLLPEVQPVQEHLYMYTPSEMTKLLSEVQRVKP